MKRWYCRYWTDECVLVSFLRPNGGIRRNASSSRSHAVLILYVTLWQGISRVHIVIGWCTCHFWVEIFAASMIWKLLSMKSFDSHESCAMMVLSCMTNAGNTILCTLCMLLPCVNLQLHMLQRITLESFWAIRHIQDPLISKHVAILFVFIPSHFP